MQKFFGKKHNKEQSSNQIIKDNNITPNANNEQMVNENKPNNFDNLFFVANAFRSKSKFSFGVSIFAILSFNEFLTVVVIVVNEFVFVFNKLFFTLSHKFSAISLATFFSISKFIKFSILVLIRNPEIIID